MALSCPLPDAVSAPVLPCLERLANLLAAGGERREVLESVLALLETDLGLERGTVMLAEGDGRELAVGLARGAPEAKGARYAWGEGITGRVFATGTPAVLRRMDEEPLFRNRVHQRSDGERRSAGFICHPIRLGRETVGTLAFDVPPQARAGLEEAAAAVAIVAAMIAHSVAEQRRARLATDLLETENRSLRRALGAQARPEGMVGSSTPMRMVYERIRAFGRNDEAVLVHGEAGTGKGLVAAAIHQASPRTARPFVRLSPAGLDGDLLTSELFGHEKNAFALAARARIGACEQADSGTLFIDQVDALPLALQEGLLRVLDNGVFRRLGSTQDRRTDLRLIVASDRDLDALVAAGSFSPNLLARLPASVHLPPLRKRREDIPPLANHVADAIGQRLGRPVASIAPEALDRLLSYTWPGNVRELEQAIEYAVLLDSDGVLGLEDLPPSLREGAGAAHPVRRGSLTDLVDSLERDLLADALRRHDGVVSRAARDLGITPRMARYKVRNLGLNHLRAADQP